MLAWCPIGGVPRRNARPVREMLELVACNLDSSLFALSARAPAARQRVGVAQGPAGDPPVLLMDEPFGALYPLTRAESAEFQALQKRLQKPHLCDPRYICAKPCCSSRIAHPGSVKTVGVFTPDEFMQLPTPCGAYLAAFARRWEIQLVNRGEMEPNFSSKTTSKSLQLTLEHLWLVESPCCWQWPSASLGILLTRRRGLSKTVSAWPNIVQTIPALRSRLPACRLPGWASVPTGCHYGAHALRALLRDCNTYTGILGVTRRA